MLTLSSRALSIMYNRGIILPKRENSERARVKSPERVPWVLKASLCPPTSHRSNKVSVSDPRALSLASLSHSYESLLLFLPQKLISTLWDSIDHSTFPPAPAVTLPNPSPNHLSTSPLATFPSESNNPPKHLSNSNS